jgi:hypothetical protein
MEGKDALMAGVRVGCDYVFENEDRAKMFTCIICLDVCRDAVGCVEQDHLMCSVCADGVIARKQSCPNRCLAPRPLTIRPIAFVRGQVNSLRVKCCACKSTVDWVGWSKHAATQCAARNKPCGVPDCAFRGTPAALDAHHRDEFKAHAALFAAALAKAKADSEKLHKSLTNLKRIALAVDEFVDQPRKRAKVVDAKDSEEAAIERLTGLGFARVEVQNAVCDDGGKKSQTLHALKLFLSKAIAVTLSATEQHVDRASAFASASSNSR